MAKTKKVTLDQGKIEYNRLKDELKHRNSVYENVYKDREQLKAEVEEHVEIIEQCLLALNMWNHCSDTDAIRDTQIFLLNKLRGTK